MAKPSSASSSIPIIFIHGFRGNHLGLQAIAEYFPSPRYTVYLPDFPPAGGQDLPVYDAVHYVEFLKHYIEQHHLHRPILVGHSLGSIIAAAFASRYPQLCHQQIFFVAPITVKPTKFFAALTPLTVLLPNRLIGYLTTKYLFIPHDRALLRRTLQLTYQCGADYTSKHSIYRAGKFSAHHGITDFTFHKDAHFISGTSDRLIPLTTTTQFAQALHATITTVPQAGHLLNYECPQTVARIIQGFIQAHSASSTQ